MGNDRISRHKLRNWSQTVTLLVGMVALLAAVGALLGGVQVMIAAATAGALALVLGPRISPRLILGMYGAYPLSPREAPRLHRLLADLAERADLPHPPDVYYIPSRVMNAFTVGKRTDAAVAVTDGLLWGLSLPEVAAVLAHEISHIRHNDTWVMGLADLVSRLTHTLSLFGQLLVLVNLPLYLFTEASLPWLALLVLVLAPALSGLLQLAVSRSREYDADIGAVTLTGDPNALASALRRLEAESGVWLERILMPRRRDPQPSLLRTHPHTEERIRRLRQLSHEQPQWLPANPIMVPEPSGLEDPWRYPVIRRRPRRHITGLWH